MRRIKIQKNGNTYYFYFRNNEFHPNVNDLKSLMKQAIYENRCSYGSIEQISHGEVTVSFNPKKHKNSTRKELIREIKTVLEATR